MSHHRDEEVQILRALVEKLRPKHYYCEDSWYSCPKDAEGCSDPDVGTECNCGADRINAEIDATLRSIPTVGSGL